MPIINSTYITDATPQADGRRRVKEIHTDHNGKKYFAEYLAPVDFDCETCMNLRAENIGVEVDRREAAENEAANFVLPITRLQFLKRLTPQERIACKTRVKSDQIAEDFFFMLEVAQDVTLGDESLMAGLNYLESVGVLGAGRALEIGSAD